ncbi:hypothetical protein FIV34_06060 [Luteibacter pinisoli]|uniref:Glycosyltransferase RgtA/B/C/D-like domain-containing protein n=1 Tax=Luteibacter pinisoli TaxID=2589080 RepID=A0A4Y5Z2L1_9GAMM|nr:hypothetical protein [Luteibacter pinisoli]QDE38795.1 hypothetical protein FIV34_06060 [Luteibacter pinisoli]
MVVEAEPTRWQRSPWIGRWKDAPWIPFLIAGLGAILAISVRWYFAAHAQVYQPLQEHTSFGGAAEYYRYAWNLLHHHLFSSGYIDDPHPAADTFRDPGYPFYLAMFMAVSDSYEGWYSAVVLSHAFLGGVTVACIVLAMRGVVPTWLLFAVATATAWWPHSVVISACILSENLTAPMWALFVLLVRESVDRKSMPLAAAAGLALAAASLTNSVLTPLVFPLALVLAWKRLMSTRQLIVLFAALALPVGAWALRNSQVTASLSSLYRVEVNLVQGSWPTYHLATQLEARHDPLGIKASRAINDEIGAMQADPRTGIALLAERMGRAPGAYAAWYASKPALLWGWEVGLGAGGIYIYPTHGSPFITSPAWRGVEAVAFVLNDALAVLALAGLVLSLLVARPPISIVVLALTVAWITVVYGVLQSDPRYSIPFRSAEITLACFALWKAGALGRQWLARGRDPTLE